MKVDVEGNIYCGGSGGVWVLDHDGNHLGTIVHGQNATTNLAFGDDDWKTLYITTWNTLCRVRVNIPRRTGAGEEADASFSLRMTACGRIRGGSTSLTPIFRL